MYRLVFILFVLGYTNIFSQYWEHTYDVEIQSYAVGTMTDYDKGIIVFGASNSHVENAHAYLLKTDVNGDVLWRKELGVFEDEILVVTILVLDDGSLLIGGAEKNNTQSHRSFLLKLNACKELVWIKIFGDIIEEDFVTEILLLNDGNILIQASYIGNERISLFKLDQDGNTIWRKNYFPGGTDPIIGEYSSAWLTDIHETEDSGFIVGGDLYVKDSLSFYHVLRTYTMKLDAQGNREWIYIFGIDDDLRSQNASIVIVENGYLVSSVYRDQETAIDLRTLLYKLDKDGDFMWSNFVSDTVLNTASFGLDQINDSTLIIATNVTIGNIAQPQSGYQSYIKVFKTDTFGNVIDTAVFGKGNIVNSFGLDKYYTTNNTLLLSGYQDSLKYRSYVLQIDMDLNIEPYNDTLLNYDNLCDHQITNSYIAFDTAVNIVIVKEQEYKILRYPNPAKEFINFEVKELENFSYNLSVFDFRGRLVFEEKNISEKKFKLNTSTFAKSIFFYKLDFGSGSVAEGSFIKE